MRLNGDPEGTLIHSLRSISSSEALAAAPATEESGQTSLSTPSDMLNCLQANGAIWEDACLLSYCVATEREGIYQWCTSADSTDSPIQ
jgi:hypothetical protein